MRTLPCPRCGATHDVSARRAGESFSCACGHTLVAPGRPAAGRWKRVLLGLAALLLLVLCGLALAAWLYLRGLNRKVATASGAQEARMNVSQLCDNVAEYQAETGSLLAAPPTPSEVPRGRAVPFPAGTAFEKLGFNPGLTSYQYQVSVQESPVGDSEVVCTARGDLDGDGQVSVFTVTLDANGMKSLVKAERETE
jgi:hypothetical protein